MWAMEFAISFHITSKEISVWKHMKCFLSTLHRRKIENVIITCHFGFVFEENSAKEITWLLWRFYIPLIFKGVFEKLRVRDGLVWTVRLNKEINIVFNFSFVVWTAEPIRCVNTVGRNKSLCVGARRVSCISLLRSATSCWWMKLQHVTAICSDTKK